VNLDETRQAEIMTLFERAQRLYQVTNNAGWNDVLDILEAEVVKYEFLLLNLPVGVDEVLLRATQGHAKVARSIFEQLQLRIARNISIGTEAAADGVKQSEADYNNL
jgi:hypothetical protein